jgi:hypothetical protein
VEPTEQLDFLVGLAEESGITVRVMPRGSARSGEPLPESGPCQVRGAPWLILAAGEPLSARIDAAVAALRRFAGSDLEDRYLPPAVRDLLERGGA